MKAIVTTFVTLTSVLAMALPAMAAQIPSEVTLFKNVNIFDGTSEDLLEGYDVVLVRDTGGPGFGIKKAIDEGMIEGPRMYLSGATISQTSGHADRTQTLEELRPIRTGYSSGGCRLIQTPIGI